MKTVTLEQAKKIDELKIEIDAEFSWLEHETNLTKDPIKVIKNIWRIYTSFEALALPHLKSLKAPTVVEMLNRMPASVNGWPLSIYKQDELPIPTYMLMYDHDEEPESLYETDDYRSFSEAVGDMFIWCAENGHLEANAPT